MIKHNPNLDKSYEELTYNEVVELFNMSKDLLWRYISEVTEEDKEDYIIYDYIAEMARQVWRYKRLSKGLTIPGLKKDYKLKE